MNLVRAAVFLIVLFSCTLAVGGQIKVSFFQTVDTVAVDFHEEMEGEALVTVMQIVLPTFANSSSCDDTRILLLSESKPIVIGNCAFSYERCNDDNTNMCIRVRLFGEIAAVADANDIRIQVRSDKLPLTLLILRSIIY